MLSTAQVAQLHELCAIYRGYNKKINLISRKDIDHLELHHIVHSLSIAYFFLFPAGTQVLDLGTGGGLPGLPLAIAFPEVHFTLLDSRKKKIETLLAIIKSLQLKNVTAIATRAEAHHQSYNFILGRAVTNLYQFYQWAAKKITSSPPTTIKNGILYLKGATSFSELKPLPWKVDVYYLRDHLSEPYFKTKELLHIYPRSPGGGKSSFSPDQSIKN